MPAGRYHYYYGQFTAYIRIIAHEPQALDSTATAATFAPVETTEEESVFRLRRRLDNTGAIYSASETRPPTRTSLPQVAA